MLLRSILVVGFIVIPIIEIALFILIGGLIGVLPTIAIILLTALAGGGLLRSQGTAVLARIQAEARAGRVPAAELGHGAMILLAGALLLTPGFFTDALGFLLFVPAVRDALWGYLRRNLAVFVLRPPRGTRRSGGARTTVIDLDASDYRSTDAAPPGSGDTASPWGRLDDLPPGRR